MKVTESVPNLSELGDFHLRLTKNGWIAMDCMGCGSMVYAATHLDLLNWAYNARRHLFHKHPGGMDPEYVYKCPLTSEDESE